MTKSRKNLVQNHHTCQPDDVRPGPDPTNSPGRTASFSWRPHATSLLLGGLALLLMPACSDEDTTPADTAPQQHDVEDTSDGQARDGHEADTTVFSPEWAACSEDKECFIIDVECCDYCNGGSALAINLKSAYEAKTHLAQDGEECAEVECTEMDCSPLLAVCQDGTCAALDTHQIGCPALDAETCEQADHCKNILGAPADEFCLRGFTGLKAVSVGCREAADECAPEQTCGLNPSSGEMLVFPTQCIPDGWEPCPADYCSVLIDCSSLNEEDCEKAEVCTPLSAIPTEDVCNNAPDTWQSILVTCATKISECNNIETCAANPDTGDMHVFPTTCTPPGWSPCPEEYCLLCSTGVKTPVDYLCIKGELTSEGDALKEGDMARFQLFPAGCWSASKTIVHEATCKLSGGPDWIADGLFCLEDLCDEECSPTDCNGIDAVECTTPPLAEGTYTVTAGTITMTFSVPGSLGFGGTCQESAP